MTTPSSGGHLRDWIASASCARGPLRWAWGAAGCDWSWLRPPTYL